jgi:hypothetical protein
VHPEGQAPGGDVGDPLLQVLEVLTHRRPAVDDQENLSERIVDLAPGAQRPVGCHRFQPQRGETQLPLLQ